MPVEIVQCDQNTETWLRARMGLPTSSQFSTVMAKEKGGGPSLTRAKYMRQLAGEIITGEPMESFTSAVLERGHAMEAEARNFYALMTGHAPELVGFIKNGRKGGSPDALIGNDGLLEIKTARADILISYIEADSFPAEHVAQCQGNLWVSEREWLDISIFWPKMPPFIKRIRRDNGYIANMAGEVARFNDELDALVEKIKAYGG